MWLETGLTIWLIKLCVIKMQTRDDMMVSLTDSPFQPSFQTKIQNKAMWKSSLKSYCRTLLFGYKEIYPFSFLKILCLLKTYWQSQCAAVVQYCADVKCSISTLHSLIHYTGQTSPHQSPLDSVGQFLLINTDKATLYMLLPSSLNLQRLSALN